MHELSLCQDLIDQLEELAAAHEARAVAWARVEVGLLAGVEARLLESAFAIAKAGTVADAAELLIEVVPPVVFCAACGRESEASPGNLRCSGCGSGETRLVRGDELILARVELVLDEDEPGSPPAA